MGDERRDARRAAIELAVEYKRLNTFFSDYTKNISQGGTFIRTDKPLAIGTEFVFSLKIPQLPAGLRLRGMVKWVVRTEAATADSPAGMGIEFLYTDHEQRRETERAVEQLMNAELGEALSNKLLAKRT